MDLRARTREERREDLGPALLLAIPCVLAGALAGAVLWTLMTSPVPPGGVEALVRRLPALMRAPTAGMVLGGLLGALAGLGIAGIAVRSAFLIGTVRNLLATALGGAAGGVIYAAGYIALNHPSPPPGVDYGLLIAEAFYSFSLVEFISIGLGAATGLAVARHAWRFQGVLAYVALCMVVAGYVAYTLLVTLPQVPPESMWLSVLLFIAEAASLIMVVLYSFYNLDVSVRKRWRRDAELAPFSKYYLPKVAFHVACYNEPPGLVLATLQSLLKVDYPADRFLVMVADDSTDPDLSAPVEAFCREKGLWYHHRADRTGFKAGALNVARRETPDDVDLIAVVDADYQVDPVYLKETVGYFINPNLAFVQTPQDYRNSDQSFLARQYSFADAYFYRAILPSRNEGNAIIFCGTMGIIRKSALEQVRGWGEKYLTEDAELSVRLLAQGWESLYINHTYGRGLVPATFDGYKKQLHRWAYGGAQLLRGHFKELIMPGLSRRQKVDFFIGGIHWFDGIYIVVIALILALMAFGGVLGLPIYTHHTREVWLIGLVPLFIMIDGIARLHLALRRSVQLPVTGTLTVLGMWFSIKLNNMSAALKALFGVKQPFVRTPKAPDRRVPAWEALVRALALTRYETFLAAIMTTATLVLAFDTWVRSASGSVELARLALVGWCSYYALIFACAPIYAFASFVTFKPAVEEPAAAEPLPEVATWW